MRYRKWEIRESNIGETQAIPRMMVKRDSKMTAVHQSQKVKSPDWTKQIIAPEAISSRWMKLIKQLVCLNIEFWI